MTRKRRTPTSTDELLSSADVARLVGVHVKSLSRMRVKGTSLPFTKDKRGRCWYTPADVLAHIAPSKESQRFKSSTYERLPQPKPAVGGRLSKRNLGIAEAMARTGIDIDGILDYLGVERAELQPVALAELVKGISRWRASSLYLVSRATVDRALGVLGNT